MKYLVFSTVLFLSVSARSQHDFQTWLEAGVSGDLAKDLDWSFDVNARIDGYGVKTFYSQVGFEYKVKKWFLPSIEYRHIIQRDKYGNYGGGHRINFNANFKKNIDRIKLGARLRYQYSFDRLASSSEFDADFDQAIRAKGSFDYDIDNSIFSPSFSTEFFYNPQYGPTGPGFSKVRVAIGTNIELDGPHKFSVKYQFDKKFNDYSANLLHVISFSYGYEIKKKKKEEPKKEED